MLSPLMAAACMAAFGAAVDTPGRQVSGVGADDLDGIGNDRVWPIEERQLTGWYDQIAACRPPA
jgi:hypothetical protein